MTDEINNNHLLAESINHYDLYIDSCKEVLKTIINIAIDDIAIINAISICKITNFSKPVIYKAIKKLTKDKVLLQSNQEQAQKNRFKLNRDKLEEIISVYQKKQKMLKK